MSSQCKLLVLALVLALVEVNGAEANSVALSGCQDRCGNLSIPYPFGTTPDCYLNEDFFITCTTELKPILRRSGDIEVLNISVDGELWIAIPPAYDCYDDSGTQTGESWQSLEVTKFFISDIRNKFTVVGCDSTTLIQGLKGGQYATGCIAMCFNSSDVVNGSCNGIGCCQTPIPRGIKEYNITVGSYFNHTYVSGFNPCSYAFLVADGMFNFSSLDLTTDVDSISELNFPVVLDWAIGEKTCKDVAQENVCKTQSHSECYDSDIGSGSGYRCRCSDGYEGNPYLSPGCQDINECAKQELNGCRNERFCIDLEGGYNCSCWQNGTGCTFFQQQIWIKVAVGTGVGVTGALLCITWLFYGFKKWKTMKLKEKFFKQNGGLMLQKNLPRCEGANEAGLIFAEEALKKATNNYDDSRIVGKGGYGTVFKGTLSDGRVVAIKKSKVVDQNQIEQFINEMIILSQVNHRNVVKLLGCCLETEVPLLVYEFVSNGTLFDHMHDKSKGHAISWEIRLRIAAETAGVLAYLHSAASTPIIHRDVKTTNILLDETYTAKVSDFGASRLVPFDQAELSTMVQGTLGYLDPEYLHTSQLTDKSDVYSFGVVLMELLTGEKALCFDRPEEKRSLTMYFLSALKEDRLFEIIEACIVSEDEVEQLQVMDVAKLAKRCIQVKGEERPSMKEVAIELEGLRMMVKHPWVNCDQSHEEEIEYLIGQRWDTSDCYGKGDSSSGYDSIRNHIALTVSDAR